MNTLYATPGSGNSLKPFLAMKQLGIPFRLVFVDVVSGQTRREKYLAINPAGTVPYLVTSDGRRLGELNAIAWYLTEETQLAPKTGYDRAKALQWMFFEQGNLEPFISPARFFISIVPHRRAERGEEIVRWQARASAGLRILDGYLSGRDFVTDSGYSVADIALFGYTHVAAGAEIDLGEYPAVQRWIHRVMETSGFVSLSDMNDHASTILADDGFQAHAS